MIQLKTIPLIQAVYYFVTGAWALVHLPSFMAITGPKTDLWLVKIVSLLILPYSLLCLYLAIQKRRHRVIALTLLTCCVLLAAAESYYSIAGQISFVYLADAAVQLLFGAYWLYYLTFMKFPGPEAEKEL